jgi:hypothetical protein
VRRRYQSENDYGFDCWVTVVPHKVLIQRIRGEYLEMPGLRLTLKQAQRLCGVDPALCQRVLDILVEVKFLTVKADGTYARLTDGANSPRPHPAKAVLETGRRSEKAS